MNQDQNYFTSEFLKRKSNQSNHMNLKKNLRSNSLSSFKINSGINNRNLLKNTSDTKFKFKQMNQILIKRDEKSTSTIIDLQMNITKINKEKFIDSDNLLFNTKDIRSRIKYLKKLSNNEFNISKNKKNNSEKVFSNKGTTPMDFSNNTQTYFKYNDNCREEINLNSINYNRSVNSNASNKKLKNFKSYALSKIEPKKIIKLSKSKNSSTNFNILLGNINKLQSKKESEIIEQPKLNEEKTFLPKSNIRKNFHSNRTQYSNPNHNNNLNFFDVLDVKINSSSRYLQLFKTEKNYLEDVDIKIKTNSIKRCLTDGKHKLNNILFDLKKIQIENDEHIKKHGRNKLNNIEKNLEF